MDKKLLTGSEGAPWKILTLFLSQGHRWNIPKNILPFYKQCLSAWSKFQDSDPKTPEKILIQPLLNNTKISFFSCYKFTNFLDQYNLYTIKDVCDKSGKIKHLSTFIPTNSSENKSLFLTWLSLIKSIPTNWLLIIQTNVTTHNQNKLTTQASDFICLDNSIVKVCILNSNKIYKYMIKKCFTARATAETNFEKSTTYTGNRLYRQFIKYLSQRRAENFNLRPYIIFWAQILNYIHGKLQTHSGAPFVFRKLKPLNIYSVNVTPL